jgi:D-alanyl-lipoteichoic acid acyltransferase DltB (MBOAT superfamily)
VLFNSHIFVFVFLPITVAGFLALRQSNHPTAAVVWMFVASSVFYAWWHVAYLGLLYALMLGNYLIGKALAEASWSQPRRRALLIVGLAANLGVLAWFKYANFLLDNFDAITGAHLELARIILPLAISFFIFQKIAFLVDTYRRQTRPRDFLHYSLFVLFFPQLIAGPIVRFQEVAPQFAPDAVTAARHRWRRDLAIGLTIFGIGLFKKVMIADGVARFSTPLFEAAAHGVTLDFVEAWVAAIAYGLQLYFDFSGYSDMAVGLARMVGIRLPVNFWSPYKATSVVDFWRRWHITLSRFLRDYLYIPLGGNRRGRPRQYVNLMMTMTLGGLWHGASWNFVVWGALHGAYLAFNHLWSALGLSLGRGAWLRRALTFIAVTVAWVFFRAADLATASSMLASMAGLNGLSIPKRFADTGVSLAGALSFDGFLPHDIIAYELRPFVIPWIAALVLACWILPNTWELMLRYRPAILIYAGRIAAGRWAWRPTAAWTAATAAALVIALLGMGDGVSEFLYFQF